MIRVEITSDISEVERRLGKLSRRANMIMKQAANSAMDKAQKTAKKKTAERYRVLQRDVTDAMTTEKATVGRPVAKITYRAEHESLTKFHVVQSRGWKKLKPSGKRIPKFYLASVLKAMDKPLTRNPKPFVATMKNEKGKDFTGIFVRKSLKGRKIKKLVGPSLTQMIGNEEVMKVIKDHSYQEINDIIEEKIQSTLRKGR